jgi:hypothetical protein
VAVQAVIHDTRLAPIVPVQALETHYGQAMKWNKLLSCLAGAASLIAGGGCSTAPPGKFFGDPVVVASPDNPVIDVVCLWEPSEGRDLSGLPRRGLKGQIMFFTHGGNSPVAVDGDVKIYQFDNHGPRETWDKPVHEFRFSAEEWNTFLQNGMLGPTYQLFIPYMRRHTEQVHVSLQLRFTPRDGSSRIFSQSVNTALPGVFSLEAAKRVNDIASLRSDADSEAKQAVVARSLGTLPTPGRSTVGETATMTPRDEPPTRLPEVPSDPALARPPMEVPSLERPPIHFTEDLSEDLTGADAGEAENPRRQFRMTPHN